MLPLLALLAAPGSCSTQEASGTVALPLRSSAGGVSYRLRNGSFAVAKADGTFVLNILTEMDLNAAVERRTLPPGDYTITLADGWRLEKQTLSGFQRVTAQLATPNPVSFTIVAGQATPVNYQFLSDGVVIALGETELDVTIGVTETNALPVVRQLVAGAGYTCALLAGGNVRCWGDGSVLGYGNTSDIGDNETPASAGNVNVGGSVVELSAGLEHVCALMGTGTARCWGHGTLGKLGYGNTNNIGDNETPASAGDINVGASVLRVAAGGDHTCAQIGTGALRCWGMADSGQLGYGNTTVIGDNEFPSFVGDVSLGLDSNNAFQIVAGGAHTCSLHSTRTAAVTGAIHCWGGAGVGQLGFGNTNNIGDNEIPIPAGGFDSFVLPGRVATQIAAGSGHTCALLDDGTVRCWGSGAAGQLGYGNTNNIGDNELASSVGAVNVGGTVVQIAAGFAHTCALLSSGGVRCWGDGSFGRLGYGNTNSIGDNETPASGGDVFVGGPVAQIAAGLDHTCALLTTGAVRCWGHGDFGQLGYGNTNNIGDNETPATAGDVSVVSASGGSTFPLTVTVTGSGTVSSSPAGILQCGSTGGDCNQDFSSGQVVTLTATPNTAATFNGWGGACSGIAFTATVTMSQARSCTALFSTPAAVPTFVAAGAGVDGTTALAVPYPAGLQANDLLILQVGCRVPNCTPATAPAGFTGVEPSDLANPSAFQRVYYRFATGTETGTLPVTLDAVTNVAAGRMYAFRGVTMTGFFEAANFSTSTSGTLPAPQIIVPGPGRLAVAFISVDNNLPLGPFTGGTGGPWTEPVAEYLTATGSNFALQFQIAPLPTGGSLLGATESLGSATNSAVCRVAALVGI